MVSGRLMFPPYFTSTVVHSFRLGDNDLIASIDATLSCLEELRLMLTSRKLIKLERKLRRNLEKLRRTCAKLLNEEYALRLRIHHVVESVVRLIENTIEVSRG